jgi:hypothetical protein
MGLHISQNGGNQLGRDRGQKKHTRRRKQRGLVIVAEGFVFKPWLTLSPTASALVYGLGEYQIGGRLFIRLLRFFTDVRFC